MLPCQSHCAAYHSGCHKNCRRWQSFQEEQRLEREAKKRYLQYHSSRCTQALRQLLRIQVRQTPW